MSVDPEHRFGVVERQIGIFTEELSRPKFETADGEEIVMVSVCLGQTHVTVISDEAHRSSQWTAAFGWSSLTGIAVGAGLPQLTLDEIPRALRGQLRRYGARVRTDGFTEAARAHMRGAIGAILDQTIGDGAGYDRIVLAAPAWLHEAVSGCLDLRPHIWSEIQDL